jgi:hypothetical protein
MSRASKEATKVVDASTPVAPDPGSGTTENAPQTAHRVEPNGGVMCGAPAILSSDKMDLMLVRLGFFDARRNPQVRGSSIAMRFGPTPWRPLSWMRRLA